MVQLITCVHKQVAGFMSWAPQELHQLTGLNVSGCPSQLTVMPQNPVQVVVGGKEGQIVEVLRERTQRRYKDPYDF